MEKTTLIVSTKYLAEALKKLSINPDTFKQLLVHEVELKGDLLTFSYSHRDNEPPRVGSVMVEVYSGPAEFKYDHQNENWEAAWDVCRVVQQQPITLEIGPKWLILIFGW